MRRDATILNDLMESAGGAQQITKKLGLNRSLDDISSYEKNMCCIALQAGIHGKMWIDTRKKWGSTRCKCAHTNKWAAPRASLEGRIAHTMPTVSATHTHCFILLHLLFSQHREGLNRGEQVDGQTADSSNEIAGVDERAQTEKDDER